jgi:ubiquinone/menaquinone biosynthesis C-methylase UbiE
MNPRFEHDQSALEAQAAALKIAFGPVVFQCVRIARSSGLLARLERARDEGISVADLAHELPYSEYALSVLLESCLSAQVVTFSDDTYRLGKTGYFVLHDEMARVNIEFIHDVCYRGLYELEASLRVEKPIGLHTLGDWPTLYEGLATMPEPARASWYAFDHLYSDSAFASLLPLAFARQPQRLMDIGANTGKWAQQCLAYSSDVSLTLLDLPRQLDVARSNLEHAGFRDRVDYVPIDLLDESLAFPGDQDVIWMSQFLSCFSLPKIRSIFRRARAALASDGRVLVLDTFWDRQQHDVSAYCLINTSPYFTAIASGNSKMYRAEDYIRCARAEGLSLLDIRDGLGICSSLLTFEAA